MIRVCAVYELVVSVSRVVATCLALLSLTVFTSRSSASDDAPKLADVVEANFHKWARQDKTLSSARVNQLVASSEIQGAEAAAVAAIHCYQRKLKGDAKPVSLEFLTANHPEDASARRDQPAAGGNLNLNYKGFLSHIRTAPRKLFAVEKPSLTGMKQGHLGDCYFISGVGAAVHHNASHVRSLFHPRTDGSCDVLFPNGRKVHVPALTDAQLALGSSAGDQGVWLNVLEIAAGTVEEEHARGAKAPALDKLGEGGDSIFTIQLLTGHKAVKELVRPIVNGQRPAPHGADIDRVAKKIGEEIRAATSHGRLVCCGIGAWQTPPGVPSHHQYAILGYDAGQVHLWNPWGGDYHFDPKGAPGLEHGYPTQHGQFKMPVHDFVRVFGGVNIESTHPVQ